MKSKQIFNNYLLATLFACLVVSAVNFATSTLKLIFNRGNTPVYAQVVDGVSNISTTDEAATITTPEREIKTIAGTYASARRSTPVVRTARATTTSGDYIIVGGRTISLISVTDTDYVPSNAAARLTGCNNDACKFIFAHNYAGLFGHLNSASLGEAITISVNGEVRTFHIAAKERVNKNTIPMWRTVRAISSDQTHYAYALMTCVGNGATERDIIYLR